MSKFKKTNFKKGVAANVEKQEKSGAEYGYLNIPKGVDLYKPESGRGKLIDIIPYIVTNAKHPDRQEFDDFIIAEQGTLWYCLPFKIHRNIGVNKDTIVCPTSFGKPCPVCEYRAKQAQAKVDKDELKQWNASKRALYLVIPIEDKKHKEEIHLWDISYHLIQKLLNEELKENDAFNNFPDLEAGYTLKLRLEEQTIGKNSFNEVTRIDFEERDAYEDDVVESAPRLDDDVLILKSYNEINAMFFELGEVEAADAIEEETTTTAPPPRKRRTTKPEPTEEEEEDDIPGLKEKEEVEDTPPPRNRRGAAPAETEKEEEPEEKAPPVRKRRGAATEEKEPEKEVPKEKEATKTEAKGKCPYGHKFGVDTDDFPKDCSKCDAWDDCIEEKEG